MSDRREAICAAVALAGIVVSLYFVTSYLQVNEELERERAVHDPRTVVTETQEPEAPPPDKCEGRGKTITVGERTAWASMGVGKKYWVRAGEPQGTAWVVDNQVYVGATICEYDLLGKLLDAAKANGADIKIRLPSSTGPSVDIEVKP